MKKTPNQKESNAKLQETPPDNTAASSHGSENENRARAVSTPRDLWLLQEQLREKQSIIPKMTNSFCWCCSLPFGSYLVACIIVGSSIVGVLQMIHTLQLIFPWMSKDLDFVFDIVTELALLLHVLLFFIGIIALYGLIKEKVRIVKYASLALLFTSIIRMVVGVFRLVVGQDLETFFFFFVYSVFYLYGFAILWSYVVEEEENQRLNILADFEAEEIVRRFA